MIKMLIDSAAKFRDYSRSKASRFDVVVVEWTSQKCTKKRGARVELLFFSNNCCFTLSLSSSS